MTIGKPAPHPAAAGAKVSAMSDDTPAEPAEPSGPASARTTVRRGAHRSVYDRAEVVAGDHAGQLRSDIARYEILHRHGGVYVDCDEEPRRPIDDLLDAELFAAWETDDVWVNNAVMGSRPGHPLLAEMIAALPASVIRHRRKRPNHMTGPRFLTPLIRDRADVTLLPSATFYPYRWDELDRRHDDHGDAYAVHHWNNAHRRAGINV